MATLISNMRITSNMAFTYVRTLWGMAISFYTSRVILRELGVEDFGIIQAVGGFVAIF